MKSSIKNCLRIILGLLLIIIGLYIVKTNSELENIIKIIMLICIGAGCGLFGHGLDSVISQRAIGNYRDIKKQLDVEINDERNIAITNKAKAKAFDASIYVYGILIVVLGMIGVEISMVAVFVVAYLFVISYAVYYRSKYEKEM